MSPCANVVIPAEAKREKAKPIIKEEMRNHGLYPKDFWSELRDEEVQAARRAVAKRLFLEARYHPILIGRCLGRSETTVLHYLKQLGNFAVVLREINAREREFKDDDQTI